MLPFVYKAQCFKKAHDIWYLSGHHHKLFNLCALIKHKSNKMQNLRPPRQACGHRSLWHTFGPWVQNVHPGTHRETQIYHFDGPTHCQFPKHFPHASCWEKKKKWDKQKRKGKTTPFLLRMEAVAQQWCTPQPCSDYHKFPSADVPFFLKPRNDCLWACGKGASQRNSEPRTPNLQTLLM